MLIAYHPGASRWTDEVGSPLLPVDAGPRTGSRGADPPTSPYSSYGSATATPLTRRGPSATAPSMPILRWSIPALFALVLSCSSSSTPEPTAPVDAAAAVDSGASTADSGADAASGQTPCELAAGLTTTPPHITGTKQPLADEPTPRGGTIAPGTYVLSALVLYTDGGLAPSNNTRNTFKILDGGQWAWASKVYESAETLAGGKYTVSGTSVTFQITCSNPGGAGTIPKREPYGFTADANGFTLYTDNGSTGAARVAYGSTYTRK